jgi:hypothetical protein
MDERLEITAEERRKAKEVVGNTSPSHDSAEEAQNLKEFVRHYADDRIWC